MLGKRKRSSIIEDFLRGQFLFALSMEPSRVVLENYQLLLSPKSLAIPQKQSIRMPHREERLDTAQIHILEPYSVPNTPLYIACLSFPSEPIIMLGIQFDGSSSKLQRGVTYRIQ